MQRPGRSGPLSGLRVVEFAGIGPVPFCAMLLADLGADVVRVDRLDAPPLVAVPPAADVPNRSRRSLGLHLKRPQALEAARRLIDQADVLIEGYRPGVMERLGLGPELSLERNPRLVYGRMSGFGQTGPLAHVAGHDINYIALSGALHAMGRRGELPAPPLNLVGDYGGGSLYLGLGVLAALLERGVSGRGQVVEASIVEGATSLMSMFYGLQAAGMWTDKRGTHALDTGGPFYEVYRTGDGKEIAVGALEGKFFASLAERIGLPPELSRGHRDEANWPALREAMTRIFATRTRDEWVALLENSDSCATGVYSMQEAAAHPHNVARGAFVEVAGVTQPAPTPRFSRTPPGRPTVAVALGAHTDEILADLGYAPDAVAALRAEGGC